VWVQVFARGQPQRERQLADQDGQHDGREQPLRQGRREQQCEAVEQVGQPGHGQQRAEHARRHAAGGHQRAADDTGEAEVHQADAEALPMQLHGQHRQHVALARQEGGRQAVCGREFERGKQLHPVGDQHRCLHEVQARGRQRQRLVDRPQQPPQHDDDGQVQRLHQQIGGEAEAPQLRLGRDVACGRGRIAGHDEGAAHEDFAPQAERNDGQVAQAGEAQLAAADGMGQGGHAWRV
jgi:hypothetical protein